MAALLELLTDQPVIICNGFPSREAPKAGRSAHAFLYDRVHGECRSHRCRRGAFQTFQEGDCVRWRRQRPYGDGHACHSGALRPKNFVHVVFDNEVYGSTGNQPTISNVVQLEKSQRPPDTWRSNVCWIVKISCTNSKIC